MIRAIAVLLVSFGGAAPAALAQTTPDPGSAAPYLATITGAADFVNAASWSAKFEMDSGNLALGNAGSEAVKAFAAQMVADHSKAAADMRNAAKADSLAVTPPPTLQPRDQAAMDDLTKLTGADFDARYIALQVQVHEEVVALFTAYAERGETPQLKAFAAKTLPVLQHHLEMAKGLTTR